MAFNIGILFALIAMFGFGAYPAFSKKLSKKHGPFVAAFYAHLIAWIILLIVLLPGYQYARPTNWIIGLIVLQGIIGSSAIGLIFKAYTKTKVSLAVTLVSTYPLLVLLASIFIYNESISSLGIIGALLVISGAWIVVADFFSLSRKKKKGLWVILGAMLLLALNIILMKPIVVGIGPRASSIFIESATVLGLFIYVLISKKTLPMNIRIKQFIFPGIFIGMAISSILFAIKHLGVGLAGAITAGSPLVTIFFGRIHLKELLGARQIIGIVSVVTGIALISL